MTTEELIALALEGQFTTYVGNPIVDDRKLLKREVLRRQTEARERRQHESQLAKAQAEYDAARRARARAEEPHPHLILTAVALAHQLPLETLLGPSRVYVVKMARHHAAWELKRRKPSWSKIRIGHLLGRDHSTVINSLEYFDAHPDDFADKVVIVQQLLTEAPEKDHSGDGALTVVCGAPSQP